MENEKLAIRGLTKIYKNGTKALNNVDITIGNGIFGLLGPNGAGKSTLMRSIATMQAPTKGKIIYEGIDIYQHPNYLRSRLGFLPQDFGVYPNVSAEKLLCYIAQLKGISIKQFKSQIDYLLEITNLQDYRKKSVSTFSGGMKQRFGVAQALLGSPELIIVDEPTSGLDPEEKTKFLNVLSTIGKQVSIILSTHIVDDVNDLCDNMCILNKGEIVRSGNPQELVREIEGKVWTATFNDPVLTSEMEDYNILSSKMTNNGTKINILSDHRPDSYFQPVKADLEMVYLSTLKYLN